jgi:YHS domain-containing protein
MSDMKVTKSRESKTYVFVSLLAHVRVSLVMKRLCRTQGGIKYMRIAVATLMILLALPSVAQAKELNNLDGNGLALQGYDPVGFFTDNRPVKGNQQFQSQYQGATYYFASAEHKAAFDKEPAQYEPQFGGFCAYGASRGKTVPIKIEAWQIVNGRLLMQYDLDVKGKFNTDPQGNLSKADKNWPGLVEKLGK